MNSLTLNSRVVTTYSISLSLTFVSYTLPHTVHHQIEDNFREKYSIRYFTNLLQFSEGIPNVNTVNYLAINERAAGNANLHADVYNSHHTWMHYKDI